MCILLAGLVGVAFMTGAASVVVPARAQTPVLSQDEIIRRMVPRPRTRGIGVRSTSSPGEAAAARTPVALQAIQFEINSASFTPRALEQVRELGKALNSEFLASFSFTVAGHTDSSGSRAYNRDLSLRRARAVKRYLVERMSVSETRVIEAGFGEDYPVKGLSPDDERNRRVELANRGVLPPAAPGSSHARSPGRRALLIGIDDYQHVSKLKGPVSDALNMAAFVRTAMNFRDADVRTLLNGEATRAGILGTIESWLVEGTGAGDEVFLYFSGHGYQREDQDGDETDGLDETLVPVDAYPDEGKVVRNMIDDDEIAALLDRLTGRRVWVVVDACHSGTATRSSAVDTVRYQKTPRMPDGSPLRVVARKSRGVGAKKTAVGDGASASFAPAEAPHLDVWSAVEAHQVALVDREAQDQGASVFTRRLLWGARDRQADANKDGQVTVDELSRYVTEQSEEYCRKYPKDCPKGLTPQLQAAASRWDDLAFARPGPALARTAAFAKDVLVSSSAEEGSGAEDRVRLKLIPGTRLALDTGLEVVVESDRAGHLVVLDADAAGNLTQVFPNEFSERAGVASNIRAGETIQLPGAKAGFELRAVPPTGKGLLLAVVSDANLRLGAVTAQHKDLSPVASPEAYLLEIEQALQAADATNGTRSWEVATLEYEIVPAFSRR